MRRFAVMSEETMPREKAVEDVRILSLIHI